VSEPSPMIQEQVSRELDLVKREIAVLRAEANAVAKPQEQSSWRQIKVPAALAIFGILGTLAGGIWQLHSGRELEREKLRSSLILRASESGDPDTTLRNLRFLVKSQLIDDPGDVITNLTIENAPSFGPSAVRPLLGADLMRIFGDPKLKPVEGSGLAQPDDSWVAENLVEVEIPELKENPGFPNSGRIRFHRHAAPHLKAAFAEISERANRSDSQLR
jgi:hypothetical protein